MKKNKKDIILDVAENLFLKKGFLGTSIDEITKEAGISKGNFYTYFDSKEMLLNEIVNNTLVEILSKFGKMKKESSKEEIIENYININISLAKKYSTPIVISLREVALFKENSKSKNLSAKIFRLIRETIKSLLGEVFNEINDEDVIFLWGITLAVWIEVAFENKIPNSKKLAKNILIGLGGN